MISHLSTVKISVDGILLHKMDSRSKIFFVILGLLILLSVAGTFYKTVILQDFHVMEAEEDAMLETEE